MSDEQKRTDLERTQELFDFLQGKIPNSVSEITAPPNLTADQAWAVIWFLGNQYWQVTDHVERCEVCGDLYETHSEGDCLDYGSAPYHFCGSCVDGREYAEKLKAAPENENAN